MSIGLRRIIPKPGLCVQLITLFHCRNLTNQKGISQDLLLFLLLYTHFGVKFLALNFGAAQEVIQNESSRHLRGLSAVKSIMIG